MSPNYMSIEIRTPDFVPDFFFLGGRKNFSKKVVWTSFGITKSLTAGNLKILVKFIHFVFQKITRFFLFA